MNVIRRPATLGTVLPWKAGAASATDTSNAAVADVRVADDRFERRRSDVRKPR